MFTIRSGLFAAALFLVASACCSAAAQSHLTANQCYNCCAYQDCPYGWQCCGCPSECDCCTDNFQCEVPSTGGYTCKAGGGTAVARLLRQGAADATAVRSEYPNLCNPNRTRITDAAETTMTCYAGQLVHHLLRHGRYVPLRCTLQTPPLSPLLAVPPPIVCVLSTPS